MTTGHKRLKGLWVSDLVVKTGFSRVSHGILKYVTQKHDITGIGVNFKGDPHNYKFPIFPAILGGDLYGIKRVVDLLNSEKFDFVFLFNDSWVVNMYLTAIKKDVKRELPKIYVYFPVDGEDHSNKWYQNFDIVTKAFTYTEFGKTVVNKAIPELELGVMPHGTDVEDFYKKYESKADAKIAVFKGQLQKLGDPNEMFVVLNANRNQPRKRLDIAMEGFSLFAKDKPSTVKYYSHCGVLDSSMDIVELSERYGIDERLIITSVGRGIQQVPESQLNDIYNASDVGLLTSLGEGWGLTPVEHAVTGAAQIVPNHSACAELFSDCGLLVEPVTRYVFDNSMVTGKLVTPESVAEALEILYADRDLLNDLGEKAMKKFTSKKYSWKEISKTWIKIFEENIDATTTALAQHNPTES